MRIFISVVVATLLGALAFEGPGAALGLLVGLVAGLIWYGRAREAKAEQARAGVKPAAQTSRPLTEFELLKARVNALEERLVRLEHGVAPQIVPDTPSATLTTSQSDVVWS